MILNSVGNGYKGLFKSKNERAKEENKLSISGEDIKKQFEERVLVFKKQRVMYDKQLILFDQKVVDKQAEFKKVNERF